MNPERLLHSFAILAESGGEAIDKDDLISKIFPTTPWDVVIQLASFVILLLIVFFIAYKPVRKLLKARGDYVEGKIKDAERDAEIARRAAEDKDLVIEEGKAEAARLVEEAKAEANLEAKSIIDNAKEEAIRRRKEADKEIEEAKAASVKEVKESIVDVAIEASSRVLEREVSREDNERLVSDFVDSIRSGEGK